jgi:hypothetical protein
MGTTRGSRVVVAGSATTSWAKLLSPWTVTGKASGGSARRAACLPAGQAEHGTPAACALGLVCIDAAKSLFENSGARLCRPRPAAASPEESVSGGILATLRMVFG